MILRRAQFLCGLRQTGLWVPHSSLLGHSSHGCIVIGPKRLRPTLELSSASRPLSISTRHPNTPVQDAILPSVPVEPVELKPVPFTLRSYQLEAIDACLQALSSGRTRIGVSSPTGSGKTTMFMHLIPRVTDPELRKAPAAGEEKGVGWARGTAERLSTSDEAASEQDTLSQSRSLEEDLDARQQTLIVVNGVELVNQAEAAARRLLPPDWSVEVEQSSRKASGFADVTIATYQTLIKEERLKKFNPSRFGLVIIDEAHHSASRSYLRLLHHFNRDVKLPSTVEPVVSRDHQYQIPLVGFSATFSRNDMMALSDVYEEIVYHREVREMLEEGWLCPVQLTSVEADLHLDEVDTNPQTGDFLNPSLAKQIDTPEVRALVLKTYLHKAQTRRSTLIFCTNLTHVENLKMTFREAGVDARSVSSEQPPKERQRLIQEFGAGKYPVLINCEVLTEGTDIPQIDCIILARPTKSRNLLVQMVGRGLRQSPESGKENCHLIDIVDNVSQGLVALPALSGLSYEDVEARQADNKLKTQVEIMEEALGSETAAPEIKKVTMVDLDDPFAIQEATPMSLPQMTKFAWVACGKGIYVLELFNSKYLRIQPEKSITQANATVFAVQFTQPKLSLWQQAGREFKPYKESKVLATADTLVRALQLGDAFVSAKFGMQGSQPYLRYAQWRERPPSTKITDVLWKLRATNKDANPQWYQRKVGIAGKEVLLSKLTMGQCTSAITALKHGASSRKQSLVKKESTKEKKAREREEKVAALAARNLPLPQST